MLDNCPNSSEFAGVRESMSVVCQSLSLFQIQLHHQSALVLPKLRAPPLPAAGTRGEARTPAKSTLPRRSSWLEANLLTLARFVSS